MTARALFLFGLVSLLTACATSSTPPGAVAPRGGPVPPTGQIDLGSWRRGNADGVTQQFAATVARRYGAGLAFAVATGDLRANQFVCARPTAARAGDPPDQVCRRQIVEAGCTHTWQAHLWDDAPGPAAKLSRVRGLYDKRCAADGGLLGGPG